MQLLLPKNSTSTSAKRLAGSPSIPWLELYLATKTLMFQDSSIERLTLAIILPSTFENSICRKTNRMQLRRQVFIILEKE
jgi:hypothetical protein